MGGLAIVLLQQAMIFTFLILLSKMLIWRF